VAVDFGDAYLPGRRAFHLKYKVPYPKYKQMHDETDEKLVLLPKLNFLKHSWGAGAGDTLMALTTCNSSINVEQATQAY